jgi:Fe-S oxidoreductase
MKNNETEGLKKDITSKYYTFNSSNSVCTHLQISSDIVVPCQNCYTSLIINYEHYFLDIDLLVIAIHSMRL